MVVDLAITTNRPTPQVTLWIQDGSTTKPCCMILWASKAEQITDQKISVGHVLCIHKVRAKPIQVNNNHHNDTCCWQFYHPWTDPEAGQDWHRLGRVDSEGHLVVEGENHPDNDPDGWMPRVTGLVDWYNQQHRTAQCLPSLSPVLCRQRTLIELQSSVGILSHVVVTVLQCHRAATAQEQQSRARNATKKRKRMHPNLPAATHAMLQDDSATMPLVDRDSKLFGVLQRACTTGHKVRLSQVQSRRDRDDDVVRIVSTLETTITVLHEDEFQPHYKDGGTESMQFTQSMAVVDPAGSHPEMLPNSTEVRDWVVDAPVHSIRAVMKPGVECKVSHRRLCFRKMQKLLELAYAQQHCEFEIEIGASVIKGSRASAFVAVALQETVQRLFALKEEDLPYSACCEAAIRMVRLMIGNRITLRWTLRGEMEFSGASAAAACRPTIVHVWLPKL